MKVIFEDDFDEEILTIDMIQIPSEGHYVEIDNESYKIKKVEWFLQDNTILISITQNSSRITESIFQSKEENLKPKIAEFDKEIKKLKKKDTELEEELISLRRHIKTQTKKTN